MFLQALLLYTTISLANAVKPVTVTEPGHQIHPTEVKFEPVNRTHVKVYFALPGVIYNTLDSIELKTIQNSTIGSAEKQPAQNETFIILAKLDPCKNHSLYIRLESVIWTHENEVGDLVAEERSSPVFLHKPQTTFCNPASGRRLTDEVIIGLVVMGVSALIIVVVSVFLFKMLLQLF